MLDPGPAFDRIGGLDGVPMLPDSDDLPARVTESLVGVPVAPHVGGELLDPPVPVRLRHRCVLGARMPKATVDVHRHLRLGEDDVGAPPQLGQWSDVDAVAQASAPELVAVQAPA